MIKRAYFKFVMINLVYNKYTMRKTEAKSLFDDDLLYYSEFYIVWETLLCDISLLIRYYFINNRKM